jgi:hypothetical protein
VLDEWGLLVPDMIAIASFAGGSVIGCPAAPLRI